MKNFTKKETALILGGYLTGTVGAKILLDPWVNFVCDHAGFSGRICAKMVRFYLMNRTGNGVAKLFLDADEIAYSIVDSAKKVFADAVHEKEDNADG